MSNRSGGGSWQAITDPRIRDEFRRLTERLDAIEALRGKQPAKLQAAQMLASLMQPNVIGFQQTNYVPQDGSRIRTLLWPTAAADPTGNNGRYLIYWDNTTDAYVALKPDTGGGGGGGGGILSTFRAYATGNQTVAGGGTYEKLNFQATNWDDTGNYDTANGRYVADADCKLIFSSTAWVQPPGANKRIMLTPYVNGNYYEAGVQASIGANGYYLASACISIIELSAGDYAEIWLFADKASQATDASAGGGVACFGMVVG